MVTVVSHSICYGQPNILKFIVLQIPNYISNYCEVHLAQGRSNANQNTEETGFLKPCFTARVQQLAWFNIESKASCGLFALTHHDIWLNISYEAGHCGLFNKPSKKLT